MADLGFQDLQPLCLPPAPSSSIHPLWTQVTHSLDISPHLRVFKLSGTSMNMSESSIHFSGLTQTSIKLMHYLRRPQTFYIPENVGLRIRIVNITERRILVSYPICCSSKHKDKDQELFIFEKSKLCA